MSTTKKDFKIIRETDEYQEVNFDWFGKNFLIKKGTKDFMEDQIQSIRETHKK